uniref:Putative triabin n=1 Tax=Panstrongylus lignarius TaxID=156445 RepID=A0A224XXT1_9HEMI
MKMIIAVTFLGILVHALAKECKLQPAMQNFDSDKYFKIPHVYVTHSKNGPEEKVCQEYETIQKRGSFPKTLIIGGYKQPGGIIPALECTNTPKAGSKGQFDVECEDKKKGGSKIYLETSVIDTDYQKYALLQSCFKSTGSDDILVMQTFRERVDERIKAVFEKKHWSLEQWFSRAKVDCDTKKN